MSDEGHDKNYISAVQHIKCGLHDRAIYELNDVIRHHEKSPESSLLLATLLMEQRDDYIGAMYFFQKSQQEYKDEQKANLASQMLCSAKKKFLKTLPAQEETTQNEYELMLLANSLKSQNLALRSQLAKSKDEIVLLKQQLASVSTNYPTELPQSNFQKTKNVTVHEVQPGDSLAKISKKFYGKEQYSSKIFEANKNTLKSPNKLKVGQQLIIPNINVD